MYGIFYKQRKPEGKPIRSRTVLIYENLAWNFPPSFGEHSITLIHEATACSLGALQLCLRNDGSRTEHRLVIGFRVAGRELFRCRFPLSHFNLLRFMCVRLCVHAHIIAFV